jgi:hypothetical protein
VGRQARRQFVATFESRTGAESPRLARKPNYSFEKRKKELDRKAKKDAKREERQRRRDEGAPEDTSGTGPTVTPTGGPPEPGA